MEEALDAQEHEDDAPPTADERRAMERLADALAAVDPAVERHDGDGWIELDAPGMQILVAARSAGINVPYWFDGGEADRVMARAYEYAAVLAEVGGYTVYDPQIEEIVAGARSEDAARIMAETKTALAELAAEPRWKFWRRR